MPILIVDDVESNLAVLGALLRRSALNDLRTHTRPSDALDDVRANDLDLIVVDYAMPEMNGVEFIEHVRQIPRHTDTPIIVVTKDHDRAVRMAAFAAGATDYISKPVDPQELKARSGSLLRLSRAQNALRDRAKTLEEEVGRATRKLTAREEEIIFRLARAAEYRDPETGEHISRMATMTRDIARELGLPEHECHEMYLAAPMHDVGKIAVADHILLKEGTYTDEERAAMAEHVRYGGEILQGSTSDLIKLASQIALTHHERWDGSGYPSGLRGEHIPLCGRIVAVADVYDALTSKRPYKAAWSREQALAFMAAEAGKQFDPRCVAALLRVIHRQQFGTGGRGASQGSMAA